MMPYTRFVGGRWYFYAGIIWEILLKPIPCVTFCTKQNYFLDNYASFELVIHYCGRAGMLNPSFLEIVPHPQFRPVVIGLLPKLAAPAPGHQEACPQTKFQIGNWRVEQLRGDREAPVMDIVD